MVLQTFFSGLISVQELIWREGTEFALKRRGIWELSGTLIWNLV